MNKFAKAINEKVLLQKNIIKKAESENRGLSSEEVNEFDALEKQILELENTMNLENKIRVDLKDSVEINQNLTPEQSHGIDSTEYKNAWLRYTQSGGKVDADTMNIIQSVNPFAVYSPTDLKNATTTQTGYFVPTTIANEILTFMIAIHPILSDIREFNIKGNFAVNIHTGVTANDAKSIPVGNCLEDEENSFANVHLGGYQYGKLVEIPWSMRAMQITAWESYLIEEIGTRLGSKLANDVFYGKGEAFLEMTGISPFLTSKAPSRIRPLTDLEYTDLTSAMGDTSKPLGTRFVYVNETTFWKTLMNMLDLTGRPLFIVDPATGIVRSTFGVQVKWESAIKDNEIYIGKPRIGYIANYNQQISTVTEDEAKCLKTNHVAWCIVDGSPTTELAWVVLQVS